MSIGPLGPADEGFTHQIADTFATVGSSDLAWIEKVCAMAAAPDGSPRLGFGLGKYHNRNVMDGYAGICLDANDTQPIAFDWLFEAELPAQLEDRTHMRRGYRVMADLVRYHQIGTASGWVPIITGGDQSLGLSADTSFM